MTCDVMVRSSILYVYWKQVNICHIHCANTTYFNTTMLKPTIFNGGRYTTYIPTDPPTVTTTDIKTIMCHIHTSVVSGYLATRGWDLTNSTTMIQLGFLRISLPGCLCGKKFLGSEIFDDLGLPPLQLLVHGTHLFLL